MMKNISMKVNPLYSDVDLSIVFQFEFEQFGNKIGEAFVSTYPTAGNPVQIRKGKHGSFTKTDKTAVIDQFEVVGGVEKNCMKKLKHFLGVIGISDVQSGYTLRSRFGE
ncbi:hypothetical protein [Rossellomorea sp. DA94]|uniref:hypothetical protein n=1 Tax=Rossellomorea sp. DA94 TaxID=3038653 RepID=UPI002448DD90|nr:hypothetical protein [Rossellomorea sp. DA94]WGG45463.1 hypothetical protein P8596_22605 [Rossellomorea sp. DA94]